MSKIDERGLFDNLGWHIAQSFRKVFGLDVNVGVFGHYDDEYPASRETPLRAIMIEYAGDFEGNVFAISSIHENSLRPAVDDAVQALDQAFSVSNADVKVSTHVFRTREEAVDQLEALFSLATLKIHTPKGEVLMVASPEFMQSVNKATSHNASSQTKLSTAEEEALEVRGYDFSDNEASDREFSDDGYIDSEVAATVGFETDRAAPGLPVSAMSATGEANAASVAAAQVPGDHWSRLLSGVEVDVSAELGSTSMRLGDLTGLNLNSVLTLDQHIDDPVNVFVNGTLFATARLVIVDDEYGIEIINVHEAVANGVVSTRLAA